MTDLRFPIGKLTIDTHVTPEKRVGWIDRIRAAPDAMRTAARGLTDEQLDTPYREGGWTVRQVIHHVPDSHIHGYARFRWTLTEERPTIKEYDEATWAMLPDSRSAPVEISLSLLEALHARWVMLLESMKPSDFGRITLHPERGPIPLDVLLQIYAWHGAHHAAHVGSLREREGW